MIVYVYMPKALLCQLIPIKFLYKSSHHENAFVSSDSDKANYVQWFAGMKVKQ